MGMHTAQINTQPFISRISLNFIKDFFWFYQIFLGFSQGFLCILSNISWIFSRISLDFIKDFFGFYQIFPWILQRICLDFIKDFFWFYQIFPWILPRIFLDFIKDFLGQTIGTHRTQISTQPFFSRISSTDGISPSIAASTSSQVMKWSGRCICSKPLSFLLSLCFDLHRCICTILYFVFLLHQHCTMR